MKTIKQEEYQTYFEKFQHFFKFYNKNPESLLSKILGSFKFNRVDINDDPIFFIIMRNIAPYNRDNILRIYDIKGSEYNRYALKEKKIKINDEIKLRKTTLKDLDFIAIEQKIQI